MRILHIITQKPFATGSGVYLSGIMAELGKHHEQYLICGLNEEAEPGLPIQNETKIVDPVLFNRAPLSFPVPGMSDVMPYRSTQYQKMTEPEAGLLINAFLEKAEAAVQRFQPDVIICQHLYLITAELTLKLKGDPRTKNIPVIGICHGSDLRQFNNTERWRDEIRAGIRRLDRVIATHSEQALTIRSLYGVSPDRLRILGSGFDQHIFRMDHSVQKAADPFTIVYTGKLSRAKGVPELLDACDILAGQLPIHLTLIGSGGDPGEFQAIRDAAAGKSYQVELPGQLGQSEIARIYQRSHLFVLPSYYEGMPLVVPEALACGLSVAVTDLPGFTSWLAPFTDRVRLIPRPPMKTLDSPTKAGRQQFILDIAQAAFNLAGRDCSLAEPDMTAMTWQGLTRKIEEVLGELKKK